MEKEYMVKKVKEIIQKYEIKFMVEYLFKYKKKLILLCLVSMLYTGLNYIGPIINVIIIDEGIGNKKASVLIIAVVSLFLIYLGMEVVSIFTTCLERKLNFSIQKEIQNEVLQYCMEEGRLKLSSGEIDTLVKQDISTYTSILCNVFEDVFKNICSIICIAGMLFALQWKLAIIIIILQFVVVYIQLKENKKIEEKSISYREKFVDLMTVINEVIGNIRNIIGTGAKKYLLKKYNTSFKDQFYENLEQMVFQMKVSSVISLFTSFVSCVILIFGGVLVIKEKMTLGELVTFSQYSSIFLTPIISLLNVPIEFSNQYPSIKSISHILKNMKELKTKNIQENGTTVIKKIEVNNLSFSYEENNIINDLSIEFQNDTINYIIGESGMGKSTMVDLLIGQLKPTIGKVLYDNISIDTMSVEDASKYVAWVSQEMVMFHDNILNNIVLDADVDMERVRQICKDCEILKDIEELPDGFDTMIAEQGSNLSGGQKNRICLARALYMGKPVLVIDEVTAGLDLETEKKVKENLKKYFRNKIVIIITHSPQFIMEEGNIYCLKNGKLLKVEK